jgi:hypothetical protein
MDKQPPKVDRELDPSTPTPKTPNPSPTRTIPGGTSAPSTGTQTTKSGKGTPLPSGSR